MEARLVASLIVLSLSLSACQTTGGGAPPASADAAQVTESQIRYEIDWSDGRSPFRRIGIPGTMRIPKAAAGKVPAVLILHSSGGIDGTGARHAANFNAAGFATLEIDMFGPRGLSGRGNLNPRQNMFDVYGALDFLAQNPAVDPARVAVTGYSYGGILSVMTVSADTARSYAKTDARFAAHVAYYPVCHQFGSGLGGKTSPYASIQRERWSGHPLLIMAGARDDYEGADTCAKLKESLPSDKQGLVTVVTYPDAGHGFDVPQGRSYYDQYACFGNGCYVQHRRNDAADEDAMRREVEFLRAAFGLSGGVAVR